MLNEEQTALFEALKKKVNLRDSMCGGLYWSVTNEECCNLANKCHDAGIGHTIIAETLGEGTFQSM
jgi:hypothetical protein